NRAAGCCWNTATTRHHAYAPCSSAPVSTMSAPTPTSRASNAAPGVNGLSDDNAAIRPALSGIPLSPLAPSILTMSDVQSQIDQLVKSNDIVLFMKGSASFPMCGFSGRAVQILKACGVDPKTLKTVNVLEDDAIRQGIK